jgi:NAD(P)-dependent dehydrogenase (short-subunit alcohol dehydrogenase family)
MDMVIVGASGGIGQYLIKTFAKKYRILGTYNHGDPGLLESSARYIHLDVSERENVNIFVNEIAHGLEKPVLIYTPGITCNNPGHKITDEEWDKTLSINLTGAMLVTRGLLPRMRELNFGRIILISSVLSRISIPGTIAYSASKAALNAMARVLAVENAKKGITANSIALGYYNVGIIRAVPDSYLKEKVLPGIPQGKLGDPANIAAAVSFIIDADYLTGITLDINGGIIGT